MAVFRVEKNKGYTVMSNHHLRNKALSLKAKGLLSQKFQNRGNLQFLPYCITHLHSIFHSLLMECCYMRIG